MSELGFKRKRTVKRCVHLASNVQNCAPSISSASMFTKCCVHKSPLVCIAERNLPRVSEHQRPRTAPATSAVLWTALQPPKPACVRVRATLSWREAGPMTVTNCEACLRARVTHFLTALLVPYQVFQDPLFFPCPFSMNILCSSVWSPKAPQ